MINQRLQIQTFERSAALERLERLRLYLSGGEHLFQQQRHLFEEQRHALLHAVQRQSLLRFFFSLEIRCSSNQF